jgi:transcriptional regulator with PAS, ATPase and Fis domain
MVEAVAYSAATVLVQGESGTGKELVARALHARSPRRAHPFVALYCGALTETLLESELFGHVKGSFTGANRDHKGLFEAANGGTIFLDEIGDIPLSTQVRLLRVLQEGEIKKVGSTDPVKVDVRVVAATHRDLPKLVRAGKFREDLFYRLNVIAIPLPPLRDRLDDVPLLAHHFVRRYSDRLGKKVRTIAPQAIELLCAYRWPGNVRELENAIERLVVTGRHEQVKLEDLPPEIRAQRGVSLRPKRERRRTVADDLFKRMTEERASFWTAVYPLYMQREITKQNVRDLVRKGLEEARGNYKIVCKLFNMEQNDYKKFLNFLRKHDCQLPFKEYRQ